jgi:cytochrome c5
MSGNDTEHESFIKTPQQLIVVCVLAFVVPVVMIIMFAKFVISVYSTEASDSSAEAVVARIKPVADITLTAAGVGGFREGEEIVKSACAACHTTGAAGAPKQGDKAAWAARISTGLNSLVQSTIKGKGGMPPKGGSTDLSDYEITRAVVYLANQSGASFKEPPPPKPAAEK